MPRPVPFACRILLGLMLACLAGSLAVMARADGPVLTAVFGLGGRYRPGGWCPVTVLVQPGTEALDGQVQALSEADPNAGRFGRGDTTAPGAALFSRPVSVTGGGPAPQAFHLDTYGLDPGAGGVTVQLAEGRARGDGRILARASSTPNGTTVPAVSGTPIADTDLLLVGFAGEPGAFAALNGRKLGLVHLPGVGAAPPGADMPRGTAQIASVLPADLPDRPAGYGGVDAFFLRGDAPLDALSEAQAAALKDWVVGGGHLVVFCPGADPGPYAAPFFRDLLPATVGATGRGTLTLSPKRLPGVQSFLPGLVTGPRGAGWVSVTTIDPAAASLPPAFWTAALMAPGRLLNLAAAREDAAAGDIYSGGGDSAPLSSAVLRAPSLDAPGTWAIGLFLLAYLIILVPVNYWVLKRLDRRELAWATIPALVLLFALGTFGVGYAAKGGRVFLNRAALVETSAGQTQAGVRGALGLFSPRRTSYDLTLAGAGISAALPSSAGPGRFGGGDTEARSSGQTRLVQTPAGVSLLDTAVNMWAMRAFDFQTTTDLGGTIDAQVSGGTLSVSNHTVHALTDCVVLQGGAASPVARFGTGDTAQISLTPARGLPLGFLAPAVLPAPGDSAVAPRMRAALAAYAQSLSRADTHAAFAAAPDEALLIGWSDDPALAGPAPRVDGQAVPGSAMSLVIVHLPLH